MGGGGGGGGFHSTLNGMSIRNCNVQNNHVADLEGK